MSNLVKDMNEGQRAKLGSIHQQVQGFYEEHDNATTYALTGLLSELTNSGHVDRRYVQEKVDILFTQTPED
jgi:hypothetical protein